MTNFKDQLNKIDKETERKQRIIDFIFYFVLVSAVCAMYLLITTESWN